jgi:alanyl-tRNA synthetase
MLADINKPIHLFDSKNISRVFLNHFESFGYKPIQGSSLLDPSVPMSFVMSAGLVQVERSVAQQGGREHNRYTLLQNCFRYFDLDTIGDSEYHLTLFHMAGAFAFGEVDRFACFKNIWDLLVDVYKLPKEALWVTYFGGGEVGGHFFEPDEETRQNWMKVGMPSNRIVALGPDNNFWKQGSSVIGEAEAPKCGPNTEVFFDRGIQFKCGLMCKPGCRCERFVEIQNTLLITWYLDEEKGLLRLIDEPFVESVIGIERLEMLLQEKSSVFEIDSILPLLKRIRQFEHSTTRLVVDTKQERILADHIRAFLFLTADGAPAPGRGGRARLMRKLARGLLTAQKLLGISDSKFIPSLINQALKIYTSQYPYLEGIRDLACEYIIKENKLFERTLDKGSRYLDQLLQIRNGNLTADDLVSIEKEFGIPESFLLAMLQQRQVPFNRQAYKTAYANWYQSVSN